jgi:hypothetical protein
MQPTAAPGRRYAFFLPLLLLAGCRLPPVGVCPDGMIYVPAGRFTYGEKATTKRKTKEEVGAYCIDQYEFPNTQGVRPLANVTWMEASAQCTAQGKRLCTEYEWEKACRGKWGRRFPWGGKFSDSTCPGSTPEGEGYASGGNALCVSPYGLGDMSGSVWEWTQNAYDGDPLRRVLRGGYDPEVGEKSARCSWRQPQEASKTSARIGFRCCATPIVAPLGGVAYEP